MLVNNKDSRSKDRHHRHLAKDSALPITRKITQNKKVEEIKIVETKGNNRSIITTHRSQKEITNLQQAALALALAQHWVSKRIHLPWLSAKQLRLQDKVLEQVLDHKLQRL